MAELSDDKKQSAARRDALLKRMLEMPPKAHQPLKKKPAAKRAAGSKKR